MRKEQRPPSHNGVEQLLFGFPPETVQVLEEIAGSPTMPPLNPKQRASLRSVAAFLSLADGGIQNVDFGNRYDSWELEKKKQARAIVVEVLAPNSRILSYEEAVEVHRRILSFRDVLRDAGRGQTLLPTERTLLPQMIEFLTQVQQRLPQDR